MKYVWVYQNSFGMIRVFSNLNEVKKYVNAFSKKLKPDHVGIAFYHNCLYQVFFTLSDNSICPLYFQKAPLYGFKGE